MYWHLFIFFLLVPVVISVNRCDAQLPEKRMFNHLEKADEGPSKISVVKLFKTMDQGLYNFSSGSVHYYNFILLQKADTFQILNCNDFIEEYTLMEKWFTGNAQDSVRHYIIPIIGLYQHNNDYHPTPPYPDLKTKKQKDKKLTYPPRKMPLTAPFVYSGE